MVSPGQLGVQDPLVESGRAISTSLSYSWLNHDECELMLSTNT